MEEPLIFPLSMDPRQVTTAFPLPIRARLSTYDSATSSDSDDTAGDTSAVVSYESALEDAAFLGRAAMPRARITGDDEDDLEDESFDDEFVSGKEESLFSNGEEEEEEEEEDKLESMGEVKNDVLKNEGGLELNDVKLGVEVEEGLDSIDDVYEQIEAVSFRKREEEEDIVSGNEAPSMEEVKDDVLENEGGLEFNDVKLLVEVDGGLDSIVDVYEEIEVVSFRKSEEEEEEEDIVSGNEALVIESMGEVKDDVLENEGGLGLNDVKFGVEVEEGLDSIDDVYEEIQAVSFRKSEEEDIVYGGNEAPSMEEVKDDVLENEDGLELNDVKLEVEVEEGLDSIDAVYEQNEAVSFRKSEEDIVSDGNEAPSMEEVKDDVLENEGALEFNDVKLGVEVEEGLDSIDDIYEQIEAVSFRKREEEDIASGGNEAPSTEELKDDVLENEGGLEFNDVKLGVEVEEALDSIGVVYEQIEAVNCRNVEQSNQLGAGGYEDFGDGFVSGNEESLFSNGREEEDVIISCNEAPIIASMGEVRDDDLENDGGLEFNDVKLELEVEEFLNSIAYLYDDQIEGVSSGNVEGSNDLSGGGCGDFGDGFVSGKEERMVFFNGFGSDEEVDLARNAALLIASAEELQDDALENEGGLELKDVNLEMNGSGVVELEFQETRNFITDLHDQIEAVSSRHVQQSKQLDARGYEDFDDGFVSGKKESVFSYRSEEEDDIAGDETPLIPSFEELPDDALKMNGSDVVELEVEEDLDSIAAVHDQIEAVSSVVVHQSNDSVLELKDLVVESGNVGAEMSNLSGDIEATQKSVIEVVKIEAEEAEFSQVDDYSEFNGFGTSNAFEPITPEECADNIKDEKDNTTNSLDSEGVNHTAGEILERCLHTVKFSAGFVDNFDEEKVESKAIVTQVSITDNYNGCEYSDSESRFDSFHVVHDERSGEEDELVISEWPARGDASLLESSEIMNHFLKEMEEGSFSSHSGLESSLNHAHALDVQIISGSDEEAKTEVDCSSKELFDISVLAALLRTPDTFKGVPQSFSMPTRRSVSIISSSTNDEKKTLHSKVDQLRLKYLHLVRRLTHLDPSPDHALSKELEKPEDDFIFSCNILVLGKTGVGKSAAINSIFREERASTDPFQPTTASVREISGVVDGVYISLIDTPGLLTSSNDRGANRKILSSVKKYILRNPPDVVLYVDRLDAYTRDFDDVPMLRMITSMLGSSIWNNAIITLTHAASTFSDGPDGSGLCCYEAIVARSSRNIQQSIQRAAGDVHLVNPVALVENHSSCSRNMDGENLLPNGLRWRPWLLLLCYSYKILAEVDTILESEDSSAQKLFLLHGRSILSSLLKSEVRFKPSRKQGEEDNMTNKVLEEDDVYEVQKLINEQTNVYLLRKLKNLDRGKGGSDENETIAEGFEQEVNPSAVPIPMYDALSPLSFHNENSPYSYRFVERKSQVLTGPEMCIRYRDCDSDYDDVMIEESFDIGHSFPISLAVQIMKDKNEFIIYPHSSIESKDLKKSKTAARILVTFLEDIWVNGFKLEDQIFHGKKLPLVASISIARAARNASYGANLEFHLTEKCLSVNRLSTFNLSSLKWSGFVVGANLQSELCAGQNSRISVCVGLTDPNTGRISIKTSTTKQVHVILLGLFTTVLSICRTIWSGGTD